MVLRASYLLTYRIIVSQTRPVHGTFPLTMPAVTRSLRSSTRLSTTTTTTTASDERKPAPEKTKTSGAVVKNKKSANSAAPPKVAGDRKRKAEEPKPELADDEPNPKPAKKAKVR